MAIINVTDSSYADLVEQAANPVLVDFWAEWCGPCRQIAPILEEISREYEGRLTIAKVNIDENPNSPTKLGVRGIPALFLYKDGEVVGSLAGAYPKSRIKKMIDEVT